MTALLRSIAKALGWAWKMFVGVACLLFILAWMAFDWVFGGRKK